MTKKYVKIFKIVVFCAGILSVHAGLYALDYQYSKNKQANEHFKTGLLYNNAEKYPKAFPYFEKAISEDPEFAAAFFEAAFALQNLGEKNKAIAYYEKGLSLQENFSPAYSQIALLYIEQGEMLKSYQWLKKGQSIYPDDIYINKMLVSVQRQYGAALNLADEAQKSGSNVVIGQAGKGVFAGPSYYKEGEMPVSVAEQKLFEEYTSKVQYFQDKDISGKDAEEQMLQWYEVVFKEYSINAKNFNYMLRKMAYGEIPPAGYVPPQPKQQD